MPRLINCECGEVVRGETDEELVANTTAHVARDPELVGKVSRAHVPPTSADARASDPATP